MWSFESSSNRFRANEAFYYEDYNWPPRSLLVGAITRYHVKHCFFLTIVIAVFLFLGTVLALPYRYRLEDIFTETFLYRQGRGIVDRASRAFSYRQGRSNDSVDEIPGAFASYRHGRDSMDTVSGAFSYRHGRIKDDSVDPVSEAFFTRTCERGDLYRAGHNFSSSNQNSRGIPTSPKVVCPRVLNPTQVSLPLTALLSFAGSGNTWTRHLLQQLTGIPTGSSYLDKTLRDNGFPFEGKRRDVIAVKTHNFGFRGEIPLWRYERVILVVRNIFDSILADTKRVISHGNHTANIRINTNTSAWRVSLLMYLERWDKFMKEAFSYNTGPTLIVYYEDMKYHLLPQLRRMADFLTYDYLSEFSFCCAIKEREGAFHRKPNNQTVEMVYNKEDRRRINKRIEVMAHFLKETHPEVSKRLLAYRMPV